MAQFGQPGNVMLDWDGTTLRLLSSGGAVLGTFAIPSTVGNVATIGTGSLTLGASKNVTISNSLTLAGTDSTTMTFPTTSATIARTDSAQTFTGDQTFAGSLIMSTAAKGLVLKQGSNGLCGTFTCNGTSAVTISNTNVAVSDAIIISLNTVGGTVGAIPHVDTITASTGFTTKGTASDTSTYNYAIIKNAA